MSNIKFPSTSRTNLRHVRAQRIPEEDLHRFRKEFFLIEYKLSGRKRKEFYYSEFY